jgi:hypothetical protein
MKKVITILFILASLGWTSVQAEWAVSAGADVQHDEGRPFAEIRYLDLDTPFFHGTKYAFSWSAFVGIDETIGAEIFYPYKDWEFGWGIEHSSYQEGMVETEWKYQLRIGYNFTKNWSVQLLHKSNCQKVCTKLPLDFLPHGSEDKENHGLNYLTASYRWK